MRGGECLLHSQTNVISELKKTINTKIGACGGLPPPGEISRWILNSQATPTLFFEFAADVAVRVTYKGLLGLVRFGIWIFFAMARCAGRI